MIFVHELHEVVGAREEAFEAAFRDRLVPALTDDDDARLLYFLHHAHGSGASYRVVTITALRDAAAFWRLQERFDTGDLADWMIELDDLRHDVIGKLLVPLRWSPLSRVELAEVPADGRLHEQSLFMEDTVWPFEGKLEEYVRRAGSHYLAEMRRNAQSERGTLLEIQAGFRTAFGAGRRREIVLWQKFVEPRGLRPLLMREVPAEFKQAGSWMHDALELRDRWESRLLRTAAWSPFW